MNCDVLYKPYLLGGGGEDSWRRKFKHYFQLASKKGIWVNQVPFVATASISTRVFKNATKKKKIPVFL